MKELEDKYLCATNETVRVLQAAPAATSMKPDEDPDTYIMNANRLRNEMAVRGTGDRSTLDWHPRARVSRELPRHQTRHVWHGHWVKLCRWVGNGPPRRQRTFEQKYLTVKSDIEKQHQTRTVRYGTNACHSLVSSVDTVDIYDDLCVAHLNSRRNDYFSPYFLCRKCTVHPRSMP